MEIKQEETTAQAEPYLPPPAACLLTSPMLRLEFTFLNGWEQL